MPNQNAVCNMINAYLKANSFSTMKFQSGDWNGIAEQVRTIEESGENVIPAIIDLEGEAKNLMFDDTYPFRAYHRMTSVNYSTDEGEYGNPGDTMQEISDFKFVFIGSRFKMGTRPENVIAAIEKDFPKEFYPIDLTPLGLNKCVIEMGEVSYDQYAIWNEEFSGNDFALPIDTIAISVRYRMNILFDKCCFSIC
jgi:hypothetical protein